jgi:hypothetical protein
MPSPLCIATATLRTAPRTLLGSAHGVAGESPTTGFTFVLLATAGAVASFDVVG